MYTFKVENVSQRCKRLYSKKLKSVKFRIISKWNLSFRYDERFSWISAVILDISKKLTWFPPVTYLGLQTVKVWAKSIFPPWPRFLWLLVAITLKVPLWWNSRYPFFFNIFVHNRSFLDMLPNFNLLRTLELTLFGPLSPLFICYTALKTNRVKQLPLQFFNFSLKGCLVLVGKVALVSCTVGSSEGNTSQYLCQGCH